MTSDDHKEVRGSLLVAAACVALVSIVMFLGCGGLPSQKNWNSWAENEIKALKRNRADARDVDDLREEIDTLKKQQQPTQVLPEPGEHSLLVEPKQ